MFCFVAALNWQGARLEFKSSRNAGLFCTPKYKFVTQRDSKFVAIGHRMINFTGQLFPFAVCNFFSFTGAGELFFKSLKVIVVLKHLHLTTSVIPS